MFGMRLDVKNIRDFRWTGGENEKINETLRIRDMLRWTTRVCRRQERPDKRRLQAFPKTVSITQYACTRIVVVGWKTEHE